MQPGSASKLYSNIDKTNAIKQSQPEELIALLLQKACVALRRAVLVLENQDLTNNNWEVRLKSTEEFNLSISKTVQIVTALREILDHDKGGNVASQLEETYTSIMAALWKSSRERDVAGMKKILDALSDLKEAWESLSKL